EGYDEVAAVHDSGEDKLRLPWSSGRTNAALEVGGELTARGPATSRLVLREGRRVGINGGAGWTGDFDVGHLRLGIFGGHGVDRAGDPAGAAFHDIEDTHATVNVGRHSARRSHGIPKDQAKHDQADNHKEQ